MSGPFGSSQWMYASGGFYPYQIEQSLRFNDDDSAYLSKLWGSAGNKKTFTYSFWIKRANIGSRMDFISFQQDVPISFNSDTIRVFLFGSDRLITSAQFRDVSAWYHIVLTVDSTDATSGDRIKLYVNGKRQTDFSTESYPSLNADANIYTVGLNQYIGRLYGGSYYFDGYVADMYYLDGIAEDASSFGETKSGIWVPKAYSGLYGTNGFYLSFADSSAIGDDLSGNGNDWTANNLVATDVVLDSPTNNFAVINATVPTNDTVSGPLSEGNTTYASQTFGDNYGKRALTFTVPTSGKYYIEARSNTEAGSGNAALIGILNSGIFDPENTSTALRSITTGQGFDGVYLNDFSNQVVFYGNGSVLDTDSRADPTVACLAIDVDNGYVYVGYEDGAGGTTWMNGGDPTSGASGTGGTARAFSADDLIVTECTVNSPSTNTSRIRINAGQDSSFANVETAQGNTDANGRGDFFMPVPSGYLALCTANLPDPAIDPAQDDVPADYFNTVLYTGTGTTDQSVTGVGFQPDFTWIKSRSSAFAHWLTDAVRGADKGLRSDATDAEYTTLPIFLSFDSDGFTVDVDSGTTNNTTNGSGSTFVAWNWLAGNGTSSNTDGSITSTVSVNQKAGFSIVGYDSNPSGTVGHGLGQTPKVIIEKKRDAASDWFVNHTLIDGSYDFMRLNTTAANSNAAVAAPTSTVFTPNSSSDSMIAYCFAEIEGYSKFGSYTGNGSTDGPFVYCGFRPAWVMVKRTDSGNNWFVLDDARDTFNLSNKQLLPNSSAAESTNTDCNVDMLSNGFKLRTALDASNGSSGTYIFMAFAEAPFKYSNAR